MVEIGEINRLSLSEIWKNEASDFTPWLCEHIEHVNKATGLTISNPIKEMGTGSFFVDIIGTVDLDDEQKVIIENQFGASNHDHLGKLLTYCASFNARYAIWIVEKARTEHIKAINRLNEYSTGENMNKVGYFLIEASAIKVDDSNPALILNVAAAPNPDPVNESKSQKIIREFWTYFLERCNSKGLSLYKNISPRTDRWLDAGSGKSGIYYSVFVTGESIRVMLGINKDEKWNRMMLEEFEKHKCEIENQIGDELVWNWGKTDKASKIIAKELTIGGYRSDKKQWPQIMDEAIDTVQKFENAFKPFIQKI